MNTKRTVVIAFTVCMTASILFASFSLAEEPVKDRDWTGYWTDRFDVKYFYDKDGIEYPSKGIFKVLRRRVFPEGQAQKEIISLDEMDCNAMKYRSLELTVVAPNGNRETTNKVAPWAYVWGNTPEESLTDDFCPEAKKPR